MANAGGASRLRTTLSLLGLLLLAVPGFAFGLFAGVAWREPGLVAGHFFGETRELAAGAPAGAADVAAAPPSAGPAAEIAKPAAPKPAPVAAPAPAPRAATPPASGGERLAVQVGAFGDSASAESLVARLRKKGYAAFVSPATGEASARWRVRVGPLATRDAADAAAAKLKAEERLPTWVVDDGRS